MILLLLDGQLSHLPQLFLSLATVGGLPLLPSISQGLISSVLTLVHHLLALILNLMPQGILTHL